MLYVGAWSFPPNMWITNYEANGRRVITLRRLRRHWLTSASEQEAVPVLPPRCPRVVALSQHYPVPTASNVPANQALCLSFLA